MTKNKKGLNRYQKNLRSILLINQRYYDILAIILMGAGGSIFIGEGGKENEWLMLFIAIALILSGGLFMFIRGVCNDLESTADAEKMLNIQAKKTKRSFEKRNLTVPVDIQDRAEEVIKSKQDLLEEIVEQKLNKSRKNDNVMWSFYVGLFLSVTSLFVVLKFKYLAENENHQNSIENTNQKSEKKVNNNPILKSTESARLQIGVSDTVITIDSLDISTSEELGNIYR